MMPRAWFPALLWALLILLITLLPAQAVPGGGFFGRYQLDKVVHAILFGVFLVLLVRALNGKQQSGKEHTGRLVAAALLAIFYGALTEVLQELSGAGRSGDVWDLVADTAGVFIAAVWLLWGAVWAAYFRNRSERYF
ncbi:MAG: VanZ family protein [Flavobacteriales bacterium]